MKKSLIIGATVVLGAFVALYVTGGSMSRHEVIVAIAAPPEEVFPWLHEPKRIEAWLGGFVESVPLTEGGPRAGARSRDMFEENGRMIAMTTEILRWDPPRGMTVSIESDIVNGVNAFELTPEGRGTRLRFEGEFRYRGVTRLFAPFIRGMVQKRHEEDFAKLKRAVEGGGGA